MLSSDHYDALLVQLEVFDVCYDGAADVERSLERKEHDAHIE